MTLAHWHCVVLIAITLFSHASAKSTVHVIDSPDGNYLQSSGQAKTFTDLSEIVTALLNLDPLFKVDSDTSTRVAAIVKPSPFDKPEAVAIINVAGVSSDGVEPYPKAVHTFQDVEERVVLNSVAALTRAGGVEHTVVDVSSLPGCGEVCLEAMLQEALTELGLEGNYSKGMGSLRGQLSVRTHRKTEAGIFDLQQGPDRLFAVELLSTWKAVGNAADDKSNRRSQGLSHSQPQLIERTLVSLQAVSKAYGRDAPQYKAALGAIQRLVDWSVQKLQDAFHNKLVAVVATFEGEQATALQILGQSVEGSVAARSLLASSVTGESAQSIESFIAWIAMWCTFFLLLFFAVAGCHCLKNMKFKQDSLLYGKNKAE